MDLELRPARDLDIAEIIRLAHVMWSAMSFVPPDDSWHLATRDVLTEGFENDTFRAIVADHPTEPHRLVACGIATYYTRTPAFWLPNGRMGYVQWMSTEPEWQRRGLGQRVLSELVAWLQSHDVTRVELHATPEGLELYQSLGFVPPAYPNLWLTPS